MKFPRPKREEQDKRCTSFTFVRRVSRDVGYEWKTSKIDSERVTTIDT
ncbi:Uncharacterized protein APZ42_028727 [Daphnia magna]|uniref:Uncharacterized protein n=1 Tax=Daphnia magna TaxID=35525 RepID=A0A164QBG2_9CRUS|nr:Uncharacterized protein APZ42_028727 [Daphnia magna]